MQLQPITSRRMRLYLLYAVLTLAFASLRRPQRLLYVEGVWDNSYSRSEMLAHAHEVAASGFDTITLAFLHVHPSPVTLFYNNILFTSATALHDVLAILRSSNSSVKRITLSVGGGGDDADFNAMASDWPTAKSSIVSLMEEYALDGLDIDYEGMPAPAVDDVIVRLLQLGQSSGWNMSVAPVDGASDYWVSLMRKASAVTPPVAWIALQTYNDGDSPLEYGIFVKAFKLAYPAAGNVVLCGTDVDNTSSAPGEERKVAAFLKSYPDMQGAFVWDYRLIALVPPRPNGTTAQYADAIQRAYAGAEGSLS